MFKKLGLGLLAVSLMFIVYSYMNPVHGVQVGLQGCRTTAECQAQIEAALENREALQEEASELLEDIDILREDIDALYADIEALQEEIDELEEEIIVLERNITRNLEVLAEIEVEIDDLMYLVAERLRLAQHMNNSHSVFAFLSESENLMDFMSRIRFFTRLANDDAEMMSTLDDLVATQNAILTTLYNEATQLEESQTYLQENQDQLIVIQIELIENEAIIQEALYAVRDEIAAEQAAIENARAIERALNMPGMADVPVVIPPVGASGMIHPLPGGRVSSEFGPRSFDGFHWGIDVAVPGHPSAPLLAVADGVVVAAGWDSGGGGNTITLRHNINGQIVDTFYAHMAGPTPLAVGTVVSQGQVVGTKGSTGLSFGPHLHFEIHPGGFRWRNSVNPRLWINF